MENKGLITVWCSAWMICISRNFGVFLYGYLGTGSSEATSVQLCWENLMSLMLFCQNLNFIWKPFNPQKSSDKNDQDGDDI